MANPSGNELVQVIGVSGGGPAATTEYFTTQQIANLGSGGGGTETRVIISSGGTTVVPALTVGSPINYIVTTTSAVTFTLPSPNSGTPCGRVNISDQSGNPNVVVNGTLINGASSAAVNTAYGSINLLDFGTGYAIQ